MSICENERKNIRKEDEGKVKISDKISMIKSNHFPYLHIELWWNLNNKLYFRTHHKPNQKIKYVNASSTHTRNTLRAIPQSILTRLASLTSRETSLKNKTIGEIYREHALALKKAKLINLKFPTFKTLWENYDYLLHLPTSLKAHLQTTHPKKIHTS